MTTHDVPAGDGRTLRVHEAGDPAGKAVLVHHGTPMTGALFEPWALDASDRGIRLLGYDRPGYGGSTPDPGRTVAAAAGDAAAIADALGIDRFATWGSSGGAPHALACAALLPDRCLGAATIAGVAPYDADGLDWLGGMGEDNVAEFGAAARGRADLDAFLAQAAAGMAGVQAAQVAEAFGDLISDVDRKALEAGMADYLAESCRRAVSTGIDGWRDDDLAFTAGWGFSLDQVRVPVAVWQGDQDRMVPLSHGRWLAAHVPGASAHLLPGEGHLSLLAHIDAILDGLTPRRA
jgi:pimeloyl-ACP methyl ester carboxylesterase